MADFLPYGRQQIDEADVEAVAEALRARMITQGQRVAEFEQALCAVTGARHAVAFSSGTAALHGAAAAADWGEGDEVIVPPITFCASANCALYVGAMPRFVDIDASTWNLDLELAAEAAAGDAVRGVVAVSFGGLPVDFGRLDVGSDVVVVEDACQALGASRDGRAVGGPGGADMTVFSFHPVKAVTTGEGGAVTTESEALADRLRRFRTHGIPPSRDPDHPEGPWYFDMEVLGFNYRLTDFQCALGISQLRHLGEWIEARNEIAGHYDERLAGEARIGLPPRAEPGSVHARHLYPVTIGAGAAARLEVFRRLRERAIGVQVHHIPVYRFSHYRETLGFAQDSCPQAERYYAGAISLPIFPAMDACDVDRVVEELTGALDEIAGA